MFVSVSASLIPIDFAIILVVAFLFAVLASRTGQPTVIAYLITGIVLGPVILDLVETTEFLHFIAELGFPLLLFVTGLEMKLDSFKSILGKLGRIAALQVITQQLLAFGVAYLVGFSTSTSFIISLCTIFGATPVVVKSLTDKHETTTESGRIDIGVLLLQDIFMVVILAFFASGEISGMQDFAMTLGRILFLGLALGGAAFIASRAVESELLRSLADNQHAFFIQGIAWGFLFIALADTIGLSLEIGGFLAGISLGQVPYSVELKEKVRPLTNLLLAVFFARIGLSLSAQDLLLYWPAALIAIPILSVSGVIVMYVLTRWQNFSTKVSFKSSINLAMMSEFGLVAGAVAVDQNLLAPSVLGYLTLIKLITNGYAVYFIKYNERIYQFFKPWLPEDNNTSNPKPEQHTVVFGNSRLDHVVRPILDEVCDKIVFVEADPHEMRKLERAGETFVFGNPRHAEVRREAGVKDAKVVISLEEDFELDKAMADEFKERYVAVANDKDEADELLRRGADHVILEGNAIKSVLTRKLGGVQ